MTALLRHRPAGNPSWWASWAVRSASLPLPKEADMAKPWRCRIRLHRWQRLRNPEGGWYRECRDCGQQRNVMGGPPSMAGPSAGGY